MKKFQEDDDYQGACEFARRSENAFANPIDMLWNPNASPDEDHSSSTSYPADELGNESQHTGPASPEMVSQSAQVAISQQPQMSPLIDLSKPQTHISRPRDTTELESLVTMFDTLHVDHVIANGYTYIRKPLPVGQVNLQNIQAQIGDFHIKHNYTKKGVSDLELPAEHQCRTIQQKRREQPDLRPTKLDALEDSIAFEYQFKAAHRGKDTVLDRFPRLALEGEDMSQPAIVQQYKDQQFLDEKYPYYVGDLKERLSKEEIRKYTRMERAGIIRMNAVRQPRLKYDPLPSTASILKDMSRWKFYSKLASSMWPEINGILRELLPGTYKQVKGPHAFLRHHLQSLAFPAPRLVQAAEVAQIAITPAAQDAPMKELSQMEEERFQRAEAQYPGLGDIAFRSVTTDSGDYYRPGNQTNPPCDLASILGDEKDHEYFKRVWQPIVPGFTEFLLLQSTDLRNYSFINTNNHYCGSHRPHMDLEIDGNIPLRDDPDEWRNQIHHYRHHLESNLRTRVGQLGYFGYTRPDAASIIMRGPKHGQQMFPVSSTATKKRRRLSGGRSFSENQIEYSAFMTGHLRSVSEPPEAVQIPRQKPLAESESVAMAVSKDLPNFFFEDITDHGFRLTNRTTGQPLVIAKNLDKDKQFDMNDLVRSLESIAEKVTKKMLEDECGELYKTAQELWDFKNIGQLFDALVNENGNVRGKPLEKNPAPRGPAGVMLKGPEAVAALRDPPTSTLKSFLDKRRNMTKKAIEALRKEDNSLKDLQSQLSNGIRGGRKLDDNIKQACKVAWSEGSKSSILSSALKSESVRNLTPQEQMELSDALEQKLSEAAELERRKLYIQEQVLRTQTKKLSQVVNLLASVLCEIKSKQDEHENPSIAPVWAVCKTAELAASLGEPANDTPNASNVANCDAALNATSERDAAKRSTAPQTTEHMLVEVDKVTSDSVNLVLDNEEITSTPEDVEMVESGSVIASCGKSVGTQTSAKVVSATGLMEVPRTKVAAAIKFQEGLWNQIVAKNIANYKNAEALTNFEHDVPAFLKHCADTNVTTHLLSDLQHYYCSQRTELKENNTLVRLEETNEACKYYADRHRAAETAWGLRGGSQAAQREKAMDPFLAKEDTDNRYSPEQLALLKEYRQPNSKIPPEAVGTSYAPALMFANTKTKWDGADDLLGSKSIRDIASWQQAVEKEQLALQADLDQNFRTHKDSSLKPDQELVTEYAQELLSDDRREGLEERPMHEYEQEALDKLWPRTYVAKEEYKDRMLGFAPEDMPVTVQEHLCNHAMWGQYMLQFPKEERVKALKEWITTGRDAWEYNAYYAEAQRPMKDRVQDWKRMRAQLYSDEGVETRDLTSYEGDHHFYLDRLPTIKWQAEDQVGE